MRGAVIIVALALAGVAHANDTQAVLKAGGLVFEKSVAVRMEREDLTIAPNGIKVRYVFRNLTPAPVTSEIAFPLPELDVGDLSETPHTFHFNGRDGDVVDFHLSVNGKAVAATLEARAVNYNGRDITQTLHALYVPLVGARSDDEITDTLAKLKPAAVKRLVAVDGAYPDEWVGTDQIKHPKWKVRAAYHWRQTFPPGTTVIEHRYRPVMGQVMFEKYADLLPDNALGALGTWPEEHRSWCATQKTIDAAAAGHDEDQANVQWVEYVLKTGANWAGPIGAFHLTISPGPKAAAFTCPIKGLTLRKVGRDLVADKAAFIPTADIAVMFLTNAGPAKHTGA